MPGHDKENDLVRPGSAIMGRIFGFSHFRVNICGLFLLFCVWQLLAGRHIWGICVGQKFATVFLILLLLDI